MLEKQESAADNIELFGELLADLSQTFDCLSYEILLAKLAVYGFIVGSLRIVNSYLTGGNNSLKENPN